MTAVVIAGLAAGGLLSSFNVLGGLALAVPFTLGTVLGGYLFRVLPVVHYRTVVLGLLFAAGSAAHIR